jgi:hypothetical protein
MRDWDLERRRSLVAQRAEIAAILDAIANGRPTHLLRIEVDLLKQQLANLNALIEQRR